MTRFSLESISFQESLRLQSTSGASDANVASYKGVLLSVERQWRYKTQPLNQGYSLALFYGQGQASGGSAFGATDSYKVGATPWSIVGIEPRMIWAWTEIIDFAVGAAATNRSVSFPDSSTVTVGTSRALNAYLFFDLDVSATKNLGLKQSIGFSDITAGPMFRWGLTYDL